MRALRIIRGARDLAILALALAWICIAWDAHKLVGSGAQGAAQLSRKLAATLDKVNRPCKGSGLDKADTCGTLALAGQTMVNAGDLIKLTQRTERSEAALITGALPPLIDKANASLEETRGSLANLRAASAGIAPLLSETQARIHDLQASETASAALIEHLDQSSAETFAQWNAASIRLNTLLDDPAVPDLLHNVNTMTITGSHMLFTADQVETKLASCTLHPHFTCYAKSSILFGAQVGGYLLH